MASDGRSSSCGCEEPKDCGPIEKTAAPQKTGLGLGGWLIIAGFVAMLFGFAVFMAVRQEVGSRPLGEMKVFLTGLRSPSARGRGSAACVRVFVTGAMQRIRALATQLDATQLDAAS
jgi:hypothetical protein